MNMDKESSIIQGAKAATGMKGAAEGPLMKHADIQGLSNLLFQTGTGGMHACVD